MAPRLRMFSESDLTSIHQASLEILRETGVEFPHQKSRDIFREHGFQVTGNKVFISEDQLRQALATAPAEFSVRARNPENSLMVGGDNYALGPTGGAPQIMEASGHLRPSRQDDYEKFTKLVQTSPLKMFMTNSVCFPADLKANSAHLDMLRLDVLNTDRVVMCPTSAPHKTVDALNMLEMIFGGRAALEAEPCSINVVNAASPLKFADDQSQAIILLAERNQPVVVTNMMMLGATGPVSVVGALALGNAEILAGIVLAQLVRPGVPVVYGTTSCPMDMKSMVAVLGTPETLWLSRGALSLADYYRIPCRTGGSLTDSHLPDAQALLDGGLVFQNALWGGAHFIMHTFGMVSSYMAASFEKFVIDEEMAAMATAALNPPTVDEAAINLNLLKNLGSGGDYLTNPATVKNFRKLYRSKFLNRSGYEAWSKAGAHDTAALAADEVARRVAAWRKPDIDPALEKELELFFQSRKKQLTAA